MGCFLNTDVAGVRWEPSAHVHVPFAHTFLTLNPAQPLSSCQLPWHLVQPVQTAVRMPRLHANEENLTPTNHQRNARPDTAKRHPMKKGMTAKLNAALQSLPDEPRKAGMYISPCFFLFVFVLFFIHDISLTLLLFDTEKPP